MGSEQNPRRASGLGWLPCLIYPIHLSMTSFEQPKAKTRTDGTGPGVQHSDGNKSKSGKHLKVLRAIPYIASKVPATKGSTCSSLLLDYT